MVRRTIKQVGFLWVYVKLDFATQHLIKSWNKATAALS
jgi:hypothetical protein